MFLRLKRVNNREYVQIVESHRTSRGPRQTLIASLGLLSELRANGDLTQLVGQLSGLIDDGAQIPRVVANGAGPDNGVETGVGDFYRLRLLDSWLARADLQGIEDAVTTTPEERDTLRRLLISLALAEWTKLVDDRALLGGLAQQAALAKAAEGQERWGANPVTRFMTQRLAGAERASTLVTVRRGRAVLLGTRFPVHHGFAVVSTGGGTVLEVQHTPSAVPVGYIVKRKTAAVQRALKDTRVAFVGDPAAANPRFIAELANSQLPFIVALRQAGHPRLMLGRPDKVECYDIRPLSEAEFGPGVRRVRCLLPGAADWEARHRVMMEELIRLAATREGLGGVAGSRLNPRLNEGEEWEGITLLATNLDWPADEVYAGFAACGGLGGIEADFSIFYDALMSADLSCDTLCDALVGWQMLMPAVHKLRTVMHHPVAHGDIADETRHEPRGAGEAGEDLRPGSGPDQRPRPVKADDGAGPRAAVGQRA